MRGRNQVEGTTSVERADAETPVRGTKEVHSGGSRG